MKMIVRNTFMAALMLGVVAVGCKTKTSESTDTTVVTDQKDTTVITNTTTTTTEITKPAPGQRTVIVTEKVPVNIQDAYKLKYPKVTTAEWNWYTPVDGDNFILDRTYYYASMEDNGKNYWVWFDDQGNWVKTQEKMKKDARLPDAVNKTLNDQYPGYTIEEIDLENDKDADMYEIKLIKGDQKAKLKILPDGTVFKAKEKTK